ncbi:response regulator transcription factor [Curtobacterium herbarum]|uniref:HTH luxR-type domain-containing protein n=1 Tax=Curtobacterium herbarum TaxID=150122 RepID=A0ABN1ZCL0_9MICO|nr:response regulator transcription factor [Curtobacterium herbarum]MBM7473825.1 DNA-binding CsgD family transcriptional regulator [Curtobacterium herbarum]MCS6544845.1 response regulator transcription factor [Curtobacterium herbarum]
MPKLLRASIVPAVATALLAAWVATQHGQFTADVPLHEDTFATSPYAVLVMVGYAATLGVARLRPTWAVIGTVLLVTLQLLFWPARFSQASWVGYLVLLPLPALVARSADPAHRRRLLAGVLAAAVGVGALLTVPTVSLSGRWGTINGLPWGGRITSDIAVWLVVAVAAAALSWRVGGRRPDTAPVPIPPLTHHSVVATLSTREREIFRLLAEGRSNADIARQAYISETTVKTHVGNILTKLELGSRSEVIAFAYRNGLMAPERAQ